MTLPSFFKSNPTISFAKPFLQAGDLPTDVQKILRLIPKTEFDAKGKLLLYNNDKLPPSNIPFAATDWNINHRYSYDRLITNQPMAIVLHWFGDRENFNDEIEGYLRGFDSIRPVANYTTNTSAHFLIGSAKPVNANQFDNSSPVGIVQTQAPDIDGVPFVASHIARMDYTLHEQALQYFVRTSYTLNQTEQHPLSILVDFYDGRRIDPNLRTIALEITGTNFDNQLSELVLQKLANVISVVIAVMKKYRIPALNILGHNEISLNKADPGKMFLALIRYLVCVQSLVSNDHVAQELVLTPFYSQAARHYSNPIIHKLFNKSEILIEIKKQAISNYLKYVREYLLLVDTPANVFRWEEYCKFWQVYDHLIPEEKPREIANDFNYPVKQVDFESRGYFLDQNNREGINFHRVRSSDTQSDQFPICLVANGECLYASSSVFYPGKFIAIFKHRLPSSAEILSIYDNLNIATDLKLSNCYKKGQVIGKINSVHSYIPAHLHFAIAFGSTWDIHIKNNQSTPLNAGPTWMQARYLDPIKFLETQIN